MAPHGLEIAVIYTTIEATHAALSHAAQLAQSLNASISLVATQLVPFPTPLDEPQVPAGLSEERLKALASHCPVEAGVRLCLCRDRVEGLQLMLDPHTVIVIGGKRRWWPTPEQRLARQLKRTGREVIFTETN